MSVVPAGQFSLAGGVVASAAPPEAAVEEVVVPLAADVVPDEAAVVVGALAQPLLLRWHPRSVISSLSALQCVRLPLSIYGSPLKPQAHETPDRIPL